MKNIPYKVRVGIAIGLFIWSILAVIFTIVFAYHHYALWVIILGPYLAVIAFILSIIFMPKSHEGEVNPPPKAKPRNHRPSHYSEKNKKPFINEKEWEELEEEEEECFVMEENNDNN